MSGNKNNIVSNERGAIKQVKIFSEFSAKDLEKEVNKFLQNCELNDTEVIVTQCRNEDGVAWTTITVVYADAFMPETPQDKEQT